VYAETDKGNGTQKPKLQIVFQWIDPAEGKKLAEVTADLTATVGPDATNPKLVSQTYDPETGQIAVAANVDGQVQKAGERFTVFADPKSQKSGTVPFMEPAAVLNGTVAGSKGKNQEGAGDGTIVLADGLTGKITKQVPTGMNYLHPMGGGLKHGYFYGSKYESSRNGNVIKESYNNTLFSVDVSTGAVVTVAPGSSQKQQGYFTCQSDQATAVVCTDGANGAGGTELIGFDDTTGKKAWGYTSATSNRVVPDVTAAYHGVVYAQTDAQPVLLDAKTGNDLPSAAPTSSDSATPGSSDTPSTGDTPSSADTPSSGDTPVEHLGSDMSLYNGKQMSPQAVSPNGGVYAQKARADDYEIDAVLVVLKPTA
jgi:hypothetical protein